MKDLAKINENAPDSKEYGPRCLYLSTDQATQHLLDINGRRQSTFFSHYSKQLDIITSGNIYRKLMQTGLLSILIIYSLLIYHVPNVRI